MSLIDSKYLEPSRARQNVHYFVTPDHAGVPREAMKIWCGSKPKDKICPKCFRTPFDNTTEICPRCGSKM